MRTHLFRGVLAFVVAFAMSAPVFAQSIIKGTVVDAQGKPVADAVILIESTDNDVRKVETKSDKKGEFLQVGLPNGNYRVTATSGNLKQSLTLPVKQGPNPTLAFRLTAASGLSEADSKAQAALSGAAQEAMAALQAGNNDVAIAKFNEVVAGVPTCSDCFYNLGVAHSNKMEWDQAETAFKKAIELKPEHGEAYSGLAKVYNEQKKFDLAVEASQKAAQIAAASGPGGANAEALYNQGVTLWNAQKFDEAKTQFEAAVKADPNMALAYYQLGMANLNLGQIPQAKEAFQGYLKVDANGPKAAEVQAFLKQLP
jgi:tetratricopeptide (TPR) repeat protein